MALLHRGAAYFFGKRKGYLTFSPQKSENDKWKNGKRYPNGCIELRADACLCLFDEIRGKSLKKTGSKILSNRATSYYIDARSIHLAGMG